MGSNLRVAPAELPDSIQVRLQRMYPGAKYFAQANALSVPQPRVNGEPLDDAALIDWTATLLGAIFPAAVEAPAA
jgi:transcription-repair coupling factor (superfamily II helicase)